MEAGQAQSPSWKAGGHLVLQSLLPRLPAEYSPQGSSSVFF